LHPESALEKIAGLVRCRKILLSGFCVSCFAEKISGKIEGKDKKEIFQLEES
jgi:hypothetical protein